MRSVGAWLSLAVVSLAFAALVVVAVALRRGDGGGIVPARATHTAEPRTETPSQIAATSTATSAPGTATPPSPAPTFGPVLPCGDILVPVGKERSLPADCEPPDLTLLPARISYVIDLPIVLREEAAAAMVTMLDAARDDGFVIVVRSAYRSYLDQERTYAYNVAAFGQEYADRSSARPGHSEHQLGTTGDLTSASNGYELEGFGRTAEGQWVAANAARFGFVLSYPEGAEAITGYVYEPWHVRYVGVDVAAAIAASGLTPIEYLAGD